MQHKCSWSIYNILTRVTQVGYWTVSIADAIMLALNKLALNVRGKRLANKSVSWVCFSNEVTFSKCQPITFEDRSQAIFQQETKTFLSSSQRTTLYQSHLIMAAPRPRQSWSEFSHWPALHRRLTPQRNLNLSTANCSSSHKGWWSWSFKSIIAFWTVPFLYLIFLHEWVV